MVRKIRTLTIRMNPFKVIRQRNVSKCHFSCRKCARLCFTNFSVSGLVSTTSRFRLFCPIPVRFATEVMSETKTNIRLNGNKRNATSVRSQCSKKADTVENKDVLMFTSGSC